MTGDAPPLAARCTADQQALLGRPIDLTRLVHALGSPLTFMLPAALTSNIREAQRTLDDLGLQTVLYTARKPNKSMAALRAISDGGFSVDVASLGELTDALAAGIPSSRIEATGPKNNAFLRLCVAHGVLVNADSIAEIERVASLVRAQHTAPLPCVARLDGFTRNGSQLRFGHSRFGIQAAEIDQILQAASEYKDAISLKGFAGHLTAPSPSDRVEMLQTLVSAVLSAREHGFDASVVNIGGGFGGGTVASKAEWSSFVSQLQMALLGQREPITWNGTGLGLTARNGTVIGSATLVDPTVAAPLSDQLVAMLETPLEAFENRTACDILLDLDLELHLEPGRSVHGGTAMTCVIVTDVRDGDVPMVVVDANRSNLGGGERNYLADPILLSSDATTNAAWSGYVVGNLCLPGDVLVYRRVLLSQAPKAGDVLAFLDTGAYFADFTESEVLGHPVARKVACEIDEDDVHWWLDELDRPMKPGVFTC